MRIFLTGATGYIGAAVLDALVRAGHDVTALVRNSEKARRVAKRGAHPIVGDLAEPESYRAVADGQDGYIHAAYDARSGRGPSIDRVVLETLLAAAKRPRTSGALVPARRFVIYTSGVWVLGRSPEPTAEDAPTNPVEHGTADATWRAGVSRVVRIDGDPFESQDIRSKSPDGGQTAVQPTCVRNSAESRTSSDPGRGG